MAINSNTSEDSNTLWLSITIVIMTVAIISFISIYPISPTKYVSQQYAVYFPIGTPHMEAYFAVIKAGGRPVRDGKFDFLIIAETNDEKFLKNIKNQGALFSSSAIIKGSCINTDNSRQLITLER